MKKFMRTEKIISIPNFLTAHSEKVGLRNYYHPFLCYWQVPNSFQEYTLKCGKRLNDTFQFIGDISELHKPQIFIHRADIFSWKFELLSSQTYQVNKVQTASHLADLKTRTVLNGILPFFPFEKVRIRHFYYHPSNYSIFYWFFGKKKNVRC